MDPIKVLIVDKNILVRRAVTNILQQCEFFDILWIANEFKDVERMVRAKRPDVILLSIDNLESEGFTILSNLRLKFPQLPVIIITPRSKEGAEAAISALRLGAIDFVSKPEHKNLILFAERHLEKRLGPLIKAVKKSREPRDLSDEALESLYYPQKSFEEIGSESGSHDQMEIAVLGGCTGGTQALFTLVEALPKNLSIPVVVVQHLPSCYTKSLANKLDAISNVTVREAQNGVRLEAGGIWIAPGGYQCEIDNAGHQMVLNIHRGLRENDMRPSIDILFRSAARIFGKKTLGILLSGSGCDGLSGAEEIRKLEGQVLVQDPKAALMPELPLAAIRKGLTREYYSPAELAIQITRRSSRAAEKGKIPEPANETIIGDTLIF